MEERKNRTEDFKRRSSRKKRRNSAFTGNMDGILALLCNKYTVIIVVVLIVLVLVLSIFGKNNNEDQTGSSGDVETTQEETGIDPGTYEFEQDTDSKLCDLIHAYFDAMKSYDAGAYMDIVVGEEMNQEKLEKKGEFIEDYRNITCYSKPGMTEGSYVAFVYYEIKFHNIDTLAPAMIRLYVCTNEDGTMYINGGKMDEELAGYVNIVSNDEQLRQLENDTNKKLADARVADGKLDALIQLLIDGSVVPTEPETTEEPETDISEMTFEERSETVITTTSVRIRSTPTTDNDDNILGKVGAGEELKRVGYNTSWSKIIYKGQEAYISSEYVITK